MPKPNPHAKALSQIGASKGGKARASVLTPEERKEIARNAVKMRWAKEKGVSVDEIGQQVSPLADSQKKPVASESGLPISLFQSAKKHD